MREDNQKFNKNYVVLFIILIIFLLTLFILVYFIRFKTDVTPSASSYNTLNAVSLSNSYVFASPVRALAGGDLIRVTVFVLDSQGNGIFDKRVSIKSDKTLDIKEVQVLTDEVGKAIFDLGSNVKGKYKIQTLIDGIPLTQELNLTFD